jgi:hypothetical protein
MWVLVRNRTSFSGILDGSGLKGNIAERWLPHLIVPALRRVYGLRGRVTFTGGRWYPGSPRAQPPVVRELH